MQRKYGSKIADQGSSDIGSSGQHLADNAGIGTELLELLMEDLQNSGLEIIRYKIPRERYAFQIYRNLGFTVESQDEDTVSFVWRRGR